MIEKPVRVETSAVYLKIVDRNGDLLCFITNNIKNKEIAEEMVLAINNKNT